MDIWKDIVFWNQGGLGNIKIFTYCHIAAAVIDWYSCCRIDLHSISDIACGGNCVCFYFKSENTLKIKRERVKWLNSIKKGLE